MIIKVAVVNLQNSVTGFTLNEGLNHTKFSLGNYINIVTFFVNLRTCWSPLLSLLDHLNTLEWVIIMGDNFREVLKLGSTVGNSEPITVIACC